MPLIDLPGLGHFKDRENAMIAEDFSASKAYAAGDYCYYNGTLYKFKTAHAAGAWTISDVELVKLADDVSVLKSAITQLEATSGGITKTIESVPIALFNDGVENSKIKKLVVDIEPVQSGTGNPTPDNVRPITGWTEAKVTRTGANIWDEDWDRGYINTATGVFENAPLYIRSAHKFDIIGGISYYASCSRSGTLGNIAIICYDANGDYISSIVIPINNAFTPPNNTRKVAFFVPSSWYTGDYANDISINYPATDTQYNPYSGDTYIITFPSEAGSVYGAKADTENKKLKLSKISFNPATFNVNNIAAASKTETTYTFSIDFANEGLPLAIADTAISNRFARNISGSGRMVQSVNMVFIVIDKNEVSSFTPTSLLAWFNANDTVFVYDISTPIEYNIEDAPIIETLSGYNNVFANTGNINLLEYYTYSKNYIDEQNAFVKALIAPVLDSMIADTALFVNDFRIVNNILYRVTAPIASGGTLTVGTNVVATTVADVLKSLLN